MRYAVLLLAGVVFAGCAGRDVSIVPVSKSGEKGFLQAGVDKVLGKNEIPESKNGISRDNTGAIMFICANSSVHEDREVFIRKCPFCLHSNYFFWDHEEERFECYVCDRAYPPKLIRCGLCGKAPKRIRTRPNH